jgi:hypothetical protein
MRANIRRASHTNTGMTHPIKKGPRWRGCGRLPTLSASTASSRVITRRSAKADRVARSRDGHASLLFDREAARSTARWQPALPPAVADLDAELDRIAKLGVEDLRAVWRERRGQEPPEALSKDLIARALADWLQEKCFGGLAPHLRKFLASISEKGAGPVRRVKVGSVASGKDILARFLCWHIQEQASAGRTPRPQSISMDSRGATGHEPIALGASKLDAVQGSMIVVGGAA